MRTSLGGMRIESSIESTSSLPADRRLEVLLNTKRKKLMSNWGKFSFSLSASLHRTAATFLMLLAAVAFAPRLSAQTEKSPNQKAEASRQTLFDTPEAAMHALIDAASAKDNTTLNKLFGPGSDQLFSGDPVEDDKDLAEFAAAAQESAQLKKEDDSKYILLVGNNNWPTPIPIVKKDDKWFFDTKAGIEEVLNRRVGENELSAITTCRAYVVAQWEYFTQGDWSPDSVAVYAQKFVSSPGKHDGLYWETSESEKPSPLGKLVAAARAEGYSSAGEPKENASAPTRTPYHGYHFKILTNQGFHAPGGRYNYIINGNMIAGYALVAYPDRWGNSGVMTFIVNQQGRVYEKNLGANTAKIAGAMTTYDPDPSWKLVPP